MRRLFLSFGGAGYLTPASGTWGSLAALPVGWFLDVIGGPLLLAAAAALAYFGGVAATRAEMAETGAHDPGWIVIDEVVGQWIALLPVVTGAWHVGLPVTNLWPGILAAFLLFRLFDIWKPGPIGWADRREDAHGVMLDDVLAGLFAALCVVVLAAVAHSGAFA